MGPHGASSRDNAAVPMGTAAPVFNMLDFVPPSTDTLFEVKSLR